MDVDEANSGPRARRQGQARADVEVRPPKACHGEETQGRAGRRRQLPIAAGHAQSHGDYRFAQDDYRKQCEALGDVARVKWHVSDEARTDQGGNSQVDGQPDTPQQETASETVHSATLKLNAAT